MTSARGTGGGCGGGDETGAAETEAVGGDGSWAPSHPSGEANAAKIRATETSLFILFRVRPSKAHCTADHIKPKPLTRSELAADR
jgi:hypothetical protein